MTTRKQDDAQEWAGGTMAGVGATITNVTQLQPYGAAVATMRISYVAEGDAPLIVQIFSKGVGDTDWDLLTTATIGAVGQTVTSDVQVAAGNEFSFRICPRTATDEVLDDEIDGQPWETFCSASYTTTTQAVNVTLGDNTKPNQPTFNAFATVAPTLKSGWGILVSWSESSAVDNYQLIWAGEDGVARDQENQDGLTFVASPVTPGVKYSFKLQSVITQFIGDNKLSGWTPANLYTPDASVQGRDLRGFLGRSGIDLTKTVSVRGVNVNHAGSLKGLMKLAS